MKEKLFLQISLRFSVFSFHRLFRHYGSLGIGGEATTANPKEPAILSKRETSKAHCFGLSAMFSPAKICRVYRDWMNYQIAIVR